MGTPALFEQVAMYFASLPCPPLPVLAVRDCPDTDDELNGAPVICSSHDLLAEMLLHAMYKDNQLLNAKRKVFQVDVTRRLMDAIRAKPPPGPERTYFLLQQYTADYISSFAMQPRGVHFAAMADVPRGHAVHKALCSWSAAQDIQHVAADQRKTAKQYGALEFRELIARHYERVVAVLDKGANPWEAAVGSTVSDLEIETEPAPS